MEWRARWPRFERSMNREAGRALSKGLKTTIVILAVMVALGLITLPGLRQAVQRLRSTPRTEEQARRDVMQEPISTPTDVQVRAQMYWLSAASPTSLEPTAIQLPLSADPVERSKQLVNALIARAPGPEKRTLPSGSKPVGFLHSAGRNGHRGFLGRNLIRNAVWNSQRAVGGGIDRADTRRKRDRDPAIENSRPRAGSGGPRGTCGSLRVIPCSLAGTNRRSCVCSRICSWIFSRRSFLGSSRHGITKNSCHDGQSTDETARPRVYDWSASARKTSPALVSNLIKQCKLRSI